VNDTSNQVLTAAVNRALEGTGLQATCSDSEITITDLRQPETGSFIGNWSGAGVGCLPAVVSRRHVGESRARNVGPKLVGGSPVTIRIRISGPSAGTLGRLTRKAVFPVSSCWAKAA
jgi:hypothetical protein